MSFYLRALKNFTGDRRLWGANTTYKLSAEPTSFSVWSARGQAREATEGEISIYDAGAVPEDTSATLISDLLGGATGAGDTLKELEDRIVAALANKAAGTDITTGTNDAKFVTSKALKDAGFVLDTDGTLAANSDVKVASQKAVKKYVDDAIPFGFRDIVSTADFHVYPAASNSRTYYRIAGDNRTFHLPTTSLIAGKTMFYVTFTGSMGLVDAGAGFTVDAFYFDGTPSGAVNQRVIQAIFGGHMFMVWYIGSNNWASTIINSA